jgi:CAAX protease family protein
VGLSNLDLVAALLMGPSLISCWGPRPVWMTLIVATLGVGYASGIYSGAAALWILLLGLAARLYTVGDRLDGWRQRAALAVGISGIVLLSLALGLHLLPGFSNRRLVPETLLTPDAAPYSVWLSFDETLAGIVVLGSCCTALIQAKWPAVGPLRQTVLIASGTIVLVVLLSVVLGYVRWEPHWTSQFFIWALVNLFSTCVSEEVFFRGFLQTQIARALGRFRWGGALALTLSAALFGAAHFAGGWTYVGVAGVAGVGYGLVLHKTNRLELAIVTHFALNAVHFLLFTYPRLA